VNTVYFRARCSLVVCLGVVALGVLTLSFVPVVNGQGQGETVTQVLVSDEPIVKAYGLVFSHFAELSESVGAKPQGRQAEVKKMLGNKWEIAVKLEAVDLQPGTMFTVVGTTVSGKIVPGSVDWLKPQGKTINPSSVKCGSSIHYQSLENLIALDEQALRKLIELRRKQKDLLAELVARSLTPELVSKLAVAEERLGLRKEKPLSLGVAPEEIARRMGTLQALESEPR
jgi:hypothetical protein